MLVALFCVRWSVLSLLSAIVGSISVRLCVFIHSFIQVMRIRVNICAFVRSLSVTFSFSLFVHPVFVLFIVVVWFKSMIW